MLAGILVVILVLIAAGLVFIDSIRTERDVPYGDDEAWPNETVPWSSGEARDDGAFRRESAGTPVPATGAVTAVRAVS